MERNNRRKYHNNRHTWNEKSRTNKNYSQRFERPRLVPRETQEDIRNKEKAIQSFKERQVVCPICNTVIEDLTSAMAHKDTGKPVHFDCALDIASKNEKLKENERFTYIGQGRFAVLSFTDMRDMRHFKIERIIEWEDKTKTPEWKSEISSLYSQT